MYTVSEALSSIGVSSLHCRIADSTIGAYCVDGNCDWMSISTRTMNSSSSPKYSAVVLWTAASVSAP